jgi:hypothetical protein
VGALRMLTWRALGGGTTNVVGNYPFDKIVGQPTRRDGGPSAGAWLGRKDLTPELPTTHD